MKCSPETNEIAAALAKAQAAMKNAVLDKTNPHFKNRYASLASVRDAVTPALAANGISVAQPLDIADGQAVVLTRLQHASGQWIESVCPIPPTPDMQKMGSAITYARRYSLSAICGIAADEDDDANAVSAPNGHKTALVETPKGFNDWLDALEAVADEGTDALKAAWKESSPARRDFLTQHDTARWERLKAKAAKVAVGA